MCCYFDFKFIGSSHPYSLKCDVKAGKLFLSVNSDEMRSSNKYPRKRTFAFDATYLYSWGDVYSNIIKHTVASPSPSLKKLLTADVLSLINKKLNISSL